MPSTERAAARVDRSPTAGDLTMLVDGTGCIACGAPSLTPRDPVPALDGQSRPLGLPDVPPPVHLCAVHWQQYETDWFLLGWCRGGHYAEALRYCRRHDDDVEPL